MSDGTALRALLRNRQMKDETVVSVTMGELRALAAEAAPLDPNWLDTILLQYANRPFGQAEGIECRDAILHALAQAAPPSEDPYNGFGPPLLPAEGPACDYPRFHRHNFDGPHPNAAQAALPSGLREAGERVAAEDERLRADLAAPPSRGLDVPASDADIERWYAAFEKVSGSEAQTFQGRAQIYWQFVAALSPTTEPEKTNGSE